MNSQALLALNPVVDLRGASADSSFSPPRMWLPLVEAVLFITMAAYFVLPQNYPVRCVDGQTLSGVTASVVKVDKFNPTFNMSTWSGTNTPYTLTVTNGVMTESGNGNSPY